MTLIALKEKTEEKKRIQKLIVKAELELKAENEKLLQLKEQLKKELADVERIEAGGLTAMFYGFLGNKDEKLDKERQEYLAAKLKYENCEKEIENLEKEIDQFKKNLLGVGFPDKEYESMIVQKSHQLKEKGDIKYMEYEELLENCFAQKKEVSEAIHAGERAQQGLSDAIHYLRKAKNWGTFDMVGGGLLATAAKHSNMDEAKDLIHGVQVWLRKFKRELSDVKIKEFPEMIIQIDTFSSFADFFFDNLIFDWVVQSKINRSLEGCEQTYSHVSKIVTQLKYTNTILAEKYKTTKVDFLNYIEKSF